MYIQETPASRIANARTHPYRLAHTHNILHNRNGKDVCMRWQRLWFAVAVSARRKLKHSDDTRNTQINKLTKEEEKVERGREKSPNNKLSSGGKSGEHYTVPWQTVELHLLLTALPLAAFPPGITGDSFLCLIFPFERRSSVDTTEHWECFEALKTPTA